MIQQISTSNYAMKFQKYLYLIRWNNATLMIMFRQNFKNNAKNKMIHNEQFIENFKIIIKIIIDLNNNLYEWALKKQYHNWRQKRGEIYVNYWTYEKKIRNITQSKIFERNNIYKIWRNAISKIQKQKTKIIKQKKRYAIYGIKRIIMHKIANRKTLFDGKSTLNWKKIQNTAKKNIKKHQL